MFQGISCDSHVNLSSDLYFTTLDFFLKTFDILVIKKKQHQVLVERGRMPKSANYSLW